MESRSRRSARRRLKGGGVAFPITGGSIDPASAAGRIDHSGGLALKAGGTRVALKSFRVHVGAKRAILTAKVGGGRLTVLSLSLKNAKVVRKGLGTTVKGVQAVLSGQAAKALNAAFDTSLFAKGLPIGSVTVKALPAEVEFAGGATTLALDPGAASALASLGIEAAPVDPATAGDDGLSFPITGGKANAKTFAGSIRHSGGIRLSRGATAVELTSFTINVDSEPDLTALAGGQRALDPQPGPRAARCAGQRAEDHPVRGQGEPHRNGRRGAQPGVLDERLHRGPRDRHRHGGGPGALAASLRPDHPNDKLARSPKLGKRASYSGDPIRPFRRKYGEP